MAPGSRLSLKYASRDRQTTEVPTNAPRRRGKAAGTAIKNHKEMNNNQKPRVVFRQGLLKPVGPWAKEFASEVGRLLRMNAPLAIRNWKKVDPDDKEELHKRILESFDVDLHVPHVRRAVNRYLGQRLRDFRCKLYKHYKEIPEGLDKREFPHEDVLQHNWVGMCNWFESEKFQKVSGKNTLSRAKQVDNHCCGSKPFVRIREELADHQDQEEPGRISMYRHTHYSKKKGCWVSPVAEENYNMMNEIQSVYTPTSSTPLTEDQVYDKVVGKRPGYVHGLGHGQDPLPAYALNELDNVEAVRRNAQEAERRAEEAERRAQEAQRRFEESERLHDESQRQTDEKLQAMRVEMLNFMAQVRGPTMMEMLMGAMGGTKGTTSMGGMRGTEGTTSMGDMGGIEGTTGMGGIERMRGIGGTTCMGGIEGMRGLGGTMDIFGTVGMRGI